MDEAVLVTAIWCDETEAFGVVEPLHLPRRTNVPLLSEQIVEGAERAVT